MLRLSQGVSSHVTLTDTGTVAVHECLTVESVLERSIVSPSGVRNSME